MIDSVLCGSYMTCADCSVSLSALVLALVSTMNMLNYWTNIRRHRVANRDITLLAHRDFLAPVPDSVLLNLANVPEDSHTKPRSTLFGPLLEQPRGSASGQNKKPLPVEKKVIAPAIVQSWVDRSQDVSR